MKWGDVMMMIMIKTGMEWNEMERYVTYSLTYYAITIRSSSSSDVWFNCVWLRDWESGEVGREESQDMPGEQLGSVCLCLIVSLGS